MDFYIRNFPALNGYLTESGEVNLRAVDLLLRGLSQVESLQLRRLQQKIDRDDQDALNIENKVLTQEHLNLIRACTGHHLGAKRGAEDAGSTLTPEAKRAHRMDNDAGLHGGEDIKTIPADAFYIKNRSTGGVRIIRPDVNPEIARRLYLMDQVKGVGSSCRSGLTCVFLRLGARIL